MGEIMQNFTEKELHQMLDCISAIKQQNLKVAELAESLDYDNLTKLEDKIYKELN